MSVMRFEKDMDGSMEPSSDGQWVRWDAHREKLARYDEAIRLIEKAHHILGDCVAGDEFERFLDDEPKEGRG